MIKATLSKIENSYYVKTEGGRVTEMGNRYPSAKRIREACKPAANEEVQISDRVKGTEYSIDGKAGVNGNW